MVNQGTKILLLAISSLTFVVALIETIFAGLTRHQYYKHRRSNIFRDGNSGDSDDTSFSYPDGAVYYAPDGYDGQSSGVTFELSSAELASGILSMVATVLVLGCTITLLRSQIKLNLLAYASAFLTIITIIVLSIFAWVFAQTNKDPDYYPGDGINTEKTLTWEGYVCQSEPFLVDYEGGQWWKKTCSLNKGSRWTLLPLFLLLVGATVLAIYVSVQQKHEIDNAPMKRTRRGRRTAQV